MGIIDVVDWSKMTCKTKWTKQRGTFKRSEFLSLGWLGEKLTYFPRVQFPSVLIYTSVITITLLHEIQSSIHPTSHGTEPAVSTFCVSQWYCGDQANFV